MGYGYKPYFVEGSEPKAMHRLMADTLDEVLAEIQTIQNEARASGGGRAAAAWPMIVLRTPKGWTGPKEVDGKKSEDYWRSHQVPFADMASNPKHITLLEDWLKSYEPEELFDEDGRLVEELRSWRRRATAGWAPTRTRTAACCCGTCACRTSATTRSRSGAGTDAGRGDAGARRLPPRRREAQPGVAELPHVRPDETASNRLAPCSRSPTAPGWRTRCPRTTTSPPTAA